MPSNKWLIMRMRYWILLLCLAAIFSAIACFQTLYMSTQRDASYRFSKSNAIFVHLGNDISVWEKNLHDVVARELEVGGFKVVSKIDEADLVLTYRLGERSETTYGYDTVPETTTAFGYFGRRRFIATTTGFRTVPYYYTVDEKGLLIRIFPMQEFKEGKRMPVWEGFIVGDKNLFDSRITEWSRALVKQIGQDYDGRVTLEH